MLIEHDIERGRYILSSDGELCVLSYRRQDSGALDVFSVFVPPSLRGRGLGAALVKGAAVLMQQSGSEVTYSCPFASRVMDGLGGMGRNERLLRKLGLIGIGERKK